MRVTRTRRGVVAMAEVDNVVGGAEDGASAQSLRRAGYTSVLGHAAIILTIKFVENNSSNYDLFSLFSSILSGAVGCN